MEIVVDLSEEQVVLRDPDDFRTFSVEVVGGGSSSLADLLYRSGLGRLREDGEHVVVDPVALRALAGAAATPSWDEGFEAMCSYAASKGWIESDGGILAHIEHDGAQS